MQDFQLLQPDAETFARVWKRVMPNESLSQIVVDAPPREGTELAPSPQREAYGERELLRQMLELLDESMLCINSLLRRHPGVWPLGESLRRSAARLRPMWYLLTGEGWMSRQGKVLEGTFNSMLREQYLREIHLSQLCRHGAEGGELGELLPSLEEASRRRRRMIRQLLSGQWGGRT